MTIENFKIPGAKLPHIPSGTEYRCENWGKDSKNDTLISPNSNNISFGVEIYKGEEYILADSPNPMLGYNHYMFKVSDIERLAKEQGMINEVKTLPKSFACKNTDEVLWDKYIAWLNEIYGKRNTVSGNIDQYYYGFTKDERVDLYPHTHQFDQILTLEEWDEIVNSKQETKIEVMNKTVKKSDLKKIYDVACSTWQGKIEKLANRNAFGDTVELTQSEVDEMFKAANSTQTRVLEEVFGKQLKELDFYSDTIHFEVDGLPVFGTSDMNQSDAFIGLPRYEGTKHTFFLNSNYKWELNGFQLTVKRK